VTLATLGEPVGSTGVGADNSDAIEIAHRGCPLCADDTDHVLGNARAHTK
jgi:hypothetical protein